VLSNSLFRAFYKAKGWRVPRDGEVWAWGLRGAVPATAGGPLSIELAANRPDWCNDTLGFAGAEFLVVRGSVDPGAYYTAHPLNPGGCAHLANGEWQFQRGLHKGRPAFVQYGDFRIWRDGNRDQVQQLREPAHPEAGTGIDLHAGVYGDRVEKSSAGCQIVTGGWNGRPWLTYRDLGFKSLSMGQTRRGGVLAYYLADASELAHFSNTGRLP
jgi:hypothetical protein